MRVGSGVVRGQVGESKGGKRGGGKGETWVGERRRVNVYKGRKSKGVIGWVGKYTLI